MIHVLLCGKVNISASLVAPRKKMIMYDRPVNLVFQLNVDPSGPALDLEVPLEIIIGTIPLRQVVEQFPPHQPPSSRLHRQGIVRHPVLCTHLQRVHQLRTPRSTRPHQLRLSYHQAAFPILRE